MSTCPLASSQAPFPPFFSSLPPSLPHLPLQQGHDPMQRTVTVMTLQFYLCSRHPVLPPFLLPSLPCPRACDDGQAGGTRDKHVEIDILELGAGEEEEGTGEI